MNATSNTQIATTVANNAVMLQAVYVEATIDHARPVVLPGTACKVLLETNEEGYLEYHSHSFAQTKLDVPMGSGFSKWIDDGTLTPFTFRGYIYNSYKKRWDECQIPHEIFLGVLKNVIEEHRKFGKILLGKGKMQDETMFVWSDAHKGTIPFLYDLLMTGKLFKELQRLFSIDTIKADFKKPYIRILFVDFKKFGINVPSGKPGDGAMITRWAFKTNKGYVSSCGIRILEDKKIQTFKGATTCDPHQFAVICKLMKVNPETIDCISTILNVKVGDVEHGEIYDVPVGHFKVVSYSSERSLKRAKITTVGTSTLGPYAKVIVDLMKEHSNVQDQANIVKAAAALDFKALMHLMMAPSNRTDTKSNECAALTMPIIVDGSWSIPKTENNVRQMFERAVSHHEQFVRKASAHKESKTGVKAGNAIATWSLDVEQWNKNNRSGSYIVKFSGQSMYIPQSFWDLTLGDFDKDHVFYYQVKKGVFVAYRNPINGPASMAVCIQKGKATNADVPEYLHPLMEAHRQLKYVPEPPKDADKKITNMSEAVDDYFRTFWNAAMNAPGVGMATNRLYAERINQITIDEKPSLNQLATDAANIEYLFVKGIKSQAGIGAIDPTAQFKVIRTHMKKKLDSFMPKAEMDDDAKAVWGLCSKQFSHAPGAAAEFLTSMSASATAIGKCEDIERLTDSIPIVYATRPYDGMAVAKAVPKHTVEMAKMCNYILTKCTDNKKKVAAKRWANALLKFYNRTTNGKFHETQTQVLFEFLQDLQTDCGNLSGDALKNRKLKAAKEIEDICLMGTDDSSVCGLSYIQDDILRAIGWRCINAHMKAGVAKFGSALDQLLIACWVGTMVFKMQMNDYGKVMGSSGGLFYTCITPESMQEISRYWMEMALEKSGVTEAELHKPITVQDVKSIAEMAHAVDHFQVFGKEDEDFPEFDTDDFFADIEFVN
jgi:hypothetical protein